MTIDSRNLEPIICSMSIGQYSTEYTFAFPCINSIKIELIINREKSLYNQLNLLNSLHVLYVYESEPLDSNLMNSLFQARSILFSRVIFFDSTNYIVQIERIWTRWFHIFLSAGLRSKNLWIKKNLKSSHFECIFF